MEFKTNDKIIIELEDGLHIEALIVRKALSNDDVKLKIIDGDEEFKEMFGRHMMTNLKRIKKIKNITVTKIRHALDLNELDDSDSTDLHKEDYEAMIDLALDTNDKEWFDTLKRKIEWFKEDNVKR